MVVDGHHTLRLVNPSFRALFDLKSDPVGQTVLRTLRETAFEEIIGAALRTGQTQHGEVERNSDKRRRETRTRLMIGDSEKYISKDRNHVFGEYIDGPDLTAMIELIYKDKEVE